MEPDTGSVGTTAATSTTGTQDTMDGNTAGARGMMERGKERVRGTVDEQRTRVARSLGTVASTLRDSGRQLGDGNEAAAGRVVERVAEQLESAASYLERSSVDEMVDGVERFARRNPALFIGAAFAVGVLGARFLKSSARASGPGYDGGPNAIGTFGDREVPATPVSSADLGPSGSSADVRTGLE